MPILRLAYVTQFLIAWIAIFVVWSEVGGQSHLDLLPWHIKLALSSGAAFCAVKATAAAVSNDASWNSRTLKWFGLMLLLMLGCGIASYYAHVYLEEDESDQQEDNSAISLLAPASPRPEKGCQFIDRFVINRTHVMLDFYGA